MGDKTQPGQSAPDTLLPPDTFLECAGTWEFESGELEEILRDIKQSRSIEMEERRSGEVEMTQVTLTAVLYKEDDLYVAECPQVGTVSQGYTIEQAMANLKQATELYLEEFPLPQVGKPLLTTFEAAVHA